MDTDELDLSEGLATIKEFANDINASYSLAYKMVRAGVVPHTIVGKGDRRIPRAAIRTYLQSRRVVRASAMTSACAS